MSEFGAPIDATLSLHDIWHRCYPLFLFPGSEPGCASSLRIWLGIWIKGLRRPRHERVFLSNVFGLLGLEARPATAASGSTPRYPVEYLCHLRPSSLCIITAHISYLSKGHDIGVLEGGTPRARLNSFDASNECTTPLPLPRFDSRSRSCVYILRKPGRLAAEQLVWEGKEWMSKGWTRPQRSGLVTLLFIFLSCVLGWPL